MSFLNRPRAGVCLAAAIAAFGFTAAAGAQVAVTTIDGAGADTYVSNDSNSGPTAVHGSGTTFEVRAFDDGRARVGMVRFDLTGITGDMTGATLSFETTSATRTRTWEVYSLNDGSDDTWDESATSYSSGIGVVDATSGNYALDIGSAPGQVTLLGTMGVSDAEGLNTSDTSSLDMSSFLNADTNNLVTLLLAFPSGTDSNPDWYVASSENTLTPPTLTLPNAAPVPEPATAGLAVLAGVGLLAARRRRS